MIGILAIDGWAVTFGTARRGLGGLRLRPGPFSLYQMQQPTHQRPVYQLHIIRCGTTVASALHSKGLIVHAFVPWTNLHQIASFVFLSIMFAGMVTDG